MPPTEPPPPPVLDEGRLATLRTLGDDLVAEVVGLFLDTAPAHLQALAAATAAGDTGEVTRAAHLLRGSAANVGLDAFAAACGQLEAGGPGALPAEQLRQVQARWEELQPVARRVAGRIG